MRSTLTSLGACLLAVGLLVAAGCGGASGDAYTADHTKPLPADQSAPGTYDANIDTLAADLPVVFSQLEWGLAAVDNQITALRATGITHSDRPVEVRAQQVDLHRIDVQIKVGLFGNRTLESRFHTALDQQFKAADQ